jgi:hypothetical protein
MLVSSTVVGVLYADALTGASAPDLSWWPAILEVFVRQASRVLEVITLQQVTGLTASRWSAPPVAQASHNGTSAEPSSRSLQ